MFDIKKYLEKFTSLETKKKRELDNICRILTEESSIPLKKETIVIEGKILKLKIAGAIKAMVLIKKFVILERIKKELGLNIENIL